MRGFWLAAISLLTTVFAPLPAQACAIAAPLNLDYVEHPDLVVVGRITHYEIVGDQRAREQRRRWLETSPDMPPQLRDLLRRQTSFLSDYARFRITVRETLVGEAPRILTVTWDNSTFGEPPSLAPGEYLVALSVQAASPRAAAVLQSPCSPAFLFESNSDEARAIRRQIAE